MKISLSLVLAVSLLSSTACVSSHNDNQAGSNSEDSISVQFNMDEGDSLDFNDPSYTTERRKIGLGETKSARMEISVPAGILSVKGGCEDLAQVAVRYRASQREFNITQDLQGDHMKARISMPYQEGIKELKDEGSACSVRLNDKIPMDLDLNLGAGKGKFELGGINAGQIKMGLGAGEFHINLAGSPVTDLKVDAGVGEAFIDLTGPRTKDLDAVLNCGIGSLNLTVPSGCGVKISITGLLGDITSEDLTREGDSWYNEAWQKDGPRMRIRINGAIGDIKLKVQ
ncbi:MAG: toast rack family protein [Bacteroidales bacterium]